MCKKIFSLTVFFSICIMMIFSCCETQKEEPEDKPAPVNPQTPVISTVSETLTYKINEQAKDLTVLATVTDGGVLSYQWYKSDSLDGEYTAITNALEKDYKPDTSVAGTTYYKCTVTNTLKGKTASKESPVSTVEVTEEGKKEEEDNNKVEIPELSTIFSYRVGDTPDALKVSATVPDGGVLSYQWYKAIINDKDFSVLKDVTGDEYIPDTSVVGTTYYKCTVTNTLDGKTASADTPIFTVVVTEIGNAMPPKIVATTNCTIDFNKEATLKVEATSLDEGTLSYKWSKSSDNINFSALPDETPSLKITSLEIGTFYYQCEVTNKIEVNHIEKTAVSKIVITVTVTAGNGNINIDFN